MIQIEHKHNEFNISKHLTHAEFRCKCSDPFCRHTLIDYKIGVCFENLRELCGDQPITVNSGFRCPVHNHMVGGVALSRHQLGQALDMVPPPGISLNEFQRTANMAGFSFVYIDADKGFMHADIRYISRR